MKNSNIVLIGTLALLSSVTFSSFVKTSGMHPSSTGAPGEGNCSNASTNCHANASIMNDNSNLVNTLTFSSNDSSYVPGQTYTLILEAQKAGITKFGFGMTALRTSNNSNQGTWIVTNTTRTHTVSGTGSLGTRKYMTHSTPGTVPVSAGLGQWSFNWKAPSTNVGNIKFYYCTNLTNNDGTKNGDALYLSSFEIHPQTNTGIEELLVNGSLFANYDHQQNLLQLHFNLLKDCEVEFQIFDSQGKKIIDRDIGQQLIGYQNEKIAMPMELSIGVYYIQLKLNEEFTFKKVII